MAGFATLRWAAREVPTVRRPDGKTDTVAHHVLVCLALYADKEGKARPGVATLARDARLTLKSTSAALARLVSAGVLEVAGDLNGTTVWRLRMEVAREESELAEAAEREERARLAHAERSRRYRARKIERDAEVERHVTPSQSVTNGSVTPNLDARDAEVGRTRRRTSTHVTPSRASQPQVSSGVTAIELPLNCHRTTPETPSPGGAPKRTRGTKAKKAPDPLNVQANDLARRYTDAMAGMVAFQGVRGVVRHALNHFTHEQVFAALRHMSTNERSRPLTRQTLLAAIEKAQPALRVVNGGYTPYRDPEDPSVYYEDF